MGKHLLIGVFAAAAALFASAALPADRLEYERRAGARYAALFDSLDRDKDGRVARSEAQGDLNFIPAFDDMDTNRDGFVTAQELRTYIERRYGAHAVSAIR